MFNTWMNDPEAFSADYDEYQALLRQLADEKAEHDAELLREARKEIISDDPDEYIEVDLCDLVREHDEAEDWMSDVEADADTLASAGYGTDEDYGYYGGDE
jgi:hypothetical protein